MEMAPEDRPRQSSGQQKRLQFYSRRGGLSRCPKRRRPTLKFCGSEPQRQDMNTILGTHFEPETKREKEALTHDKLPKRSSDIAETNKRSYMDTLKAYSFSASKARVRLHKVGFPRETWAKTGDNPMHSLPKPLCTFLLETIRDELRDCYIRCDEIIIFNTETPISRTPYLIIQICAMQEDISDWFTAAHNIWVRLNFILEKKMPEFACDNLQIGIWKPLDFGRSGDGLGSKKSSEGTVCYDKEPEAPLSVGKGPERELRRSDRRKRALRRESAS